MHARGLGAIRSRDYVIVLCDDLERMAAFYSDVFGLAVEDETPGEWLGFRLGTLFLAVRARGRSYDGPSPASEAASIQLLLSFSTIVENQDTLQFVKALTEIGPSDWDFVG